MTEQRGAMGWTVGNGSRHRVALTVDMEHPSRSAHDVGCPERILDALGSARVRATFFVQGRWARAEPATALRVVRDGHLLGCHSHFHAPLVDLTDAGIRRDVEAATHALVEVTGTESRPWFRCPFGAGHDDKRVLDVLQDCG
ncbi:MAG TPA: polysaccharide deacetylase family protein, partial [Actinomycetes bacterium]|nr:polysaccharide deacetylase family protein [Actinomycetes bacterium]